MGKIVLSYRRDDARTITNWLYEKLVDRYGAETVFRDIDSIAPTENFKKRIGRALKDCDFVVAVIGPAWHGPLPDGQSRINAANDWVRVEIETALQLDIPLLPILVEEAEMPDPELLPPSLREVTEINALPISSGGSRFYDDLNKLFSTIESVAGIAAAGTVAAGPATPQSAPPPQPAAAARTTPDSPRAGPAAPPSPPPPSPEARRYDPAGASVHGFGPAAYAPPPSPAQPGRGWRLFEGRTLLLLFAMPAIVMTLLWAWAFENVFGGGVSGAIAPITVFAVAGLFMGGLGLVMKRKAKLGFLVALLLGALVGAIVFAVIATAYFRSENDLSMGFIVFVLGGAAATVAGFGLGSIKWGENRPLP